MNNEESPRNSVYTLVLIELLFSIAIVTSTSKTVALIDRIYGNISNSRGVGCVLYVHLAGQFRWSYTTISSTLTMPLLNTTEVNEDTRGECQGAIECSVDMID